MKIFKKLNKKDKNTSSNTSKEAAKERLHLVLMQDRANVSADFLELMKQEIIDVIKKYIDIDERAIDVRLTNKENEDGTNGAPALYANIPIINIKNETKKLEVKQTEPSNSSDKQEENINEQETSNKNEIEPVEEIEKPDTADKEEQSQEEKQEVEKIEEIEDKNEEKNQTEEELKSKN